MAEDPIIAIVGNVKTHPNAPEAAEALGSALAKARLRILVYSSGEDFLERHIVKGYVASQAAAKRSVQVRYALHGSKPAFPEQQTHAEVFDWRPDPSPDWEVSFYQSLSDADGILLMGGGDATRIAGVVAMGHGIAILAVAGLDGAGARVWERLRPGRDLPSNDEISLMGRPWSADQAAEFATLLKDQIARKAALATLQRMAEIRSQISVTWRAVVAVLFFLLAVACVPVALAWKHIPESIPNVAAVFLSAAGRHRRFHDPPGVRCQPAFRGNLATVRHDHGRSGPDRRWSRRAALHYLSDYDRHSRSGRCRGSRSSQETGALRRAHRIRGRVDPGRCLPQADILGRG